MDTYADSYTSYQADLAYRREQLVTGLGASRRNSRTGRTRWSRLLGRETGDPALTRADLARGA